MHKSIVVKSIIIFVDRMVMVLVFRYFKQQTSAAIICTKVFLYNNLTKNL